MVRKIKLRLWLAVLLLVLALVLLIPASWPVGHDQNSLRISLNSSQPVATNGNLLENENPSFLWDYPRSILMGDTGLVHVLFGMDDSENKASPSGSEAQQVASRYDKYNVVVVSRFDLDGVDVSPQGDVSETLSPKEKTHFYWSLSPRHSGSYRGTMWFFVNLIPKEGGAAVQIPILAKPMMIQVNTILGVPANLVRWFAIICIVMGSILGLPYLERISRRAWRLLFRK